MGYYNNMTDTYHFVATWTPRGCSVSCGRPEICRAAVLLLTTL